MGTDLLLPISVAVIDSSQSILDTIGLMLHPPRFDLRATARTLEGIEVILREQRPRLLVLDHTLDGPDALAWLERSRERRERESVRTCVLTADLEGEVFERAGPLGVGGLVSKLNAPRDIADLLVETARGSALVVCPECRAVLETVREQRLRSQRLLEQGLALIRTSEQLCADARGHVRESRVQRLVPAAGAGPARIAAATAELRRLMGLLERLEQRGGADDSALVRFAHACVLRVSAALEGDASRAAAAGRAVDAAASRLRADPRFAGIVERWMLAGSRRDLAGARDLIRDVLAIIVDGPPGGR